MSAEPPRKPSPRQIGPGGDPASAFEVWLKRGLKEIYGEALREPISKELHDLIEQDRRKREGDGGDL